MKDLLSAIAIGPGLITVVILWGLVPSIVIRLISLSFPKGDPRRAEMRGEMSAVPRWEKPLWALDQVERIFFEAIPARIAARKSRRSREIAKPSESDFEDLVSMGRGPEIYIARGENAFDPDWRQRVVKSKQKRRRVISIVGAEGDRERAGRHNLGELAASMSDVVIVTDDHTRFENPGSIRASLIEGALLAEGVCEVHEISPPEDAIRSAVKMAESGDIVVWIAECHEGYRSVEGVRSPFSSRDLAAASLEAKAAEK